MIGKFFGRIKNRERGQSLVALAVIASMTAAFTAAIYKESGIRSFDSALHQFEVSIARSAFEKAAKQLRFLYQNNAACDPSAFAQVVMSLPNATSMANSAVATQNCDLSATTGIADVSPSCRAIEVISPNEAAYFAGLYVFVGAVVFDRIDSCILNGAPGSGTTVNDIDPAATACTTTTNIPQGSVGVHLRTIVNGTKYQEWIVLLDTCSTQTLPYTTTPGTSGAGAGLGTGWILGSQHIPANPAPPNVLVGVNPPDLTCPYSGPGAVANNFGRVNLGDSTSPDWRYDLVRIRRQISLIQAPFDAVDDVGNPECMDTNQDGVVDERDLNLYEKYLSGWIPHIPARGR